MIQTRKMEEGDKTPTLYSLYEDQYNFNDLSRKVDSGMDDYISTLKKGRKYEREFREAVANIMSGISDGTITFGSGRFNDSLGRYTNNKDKNKDVYGWAANYVYDLMLKAKKYEPQEDTSKIKWDNTAGTLALLRTVFNSNTPNYGYFIELDPYNAETGVRDTTNRAKVLRNFIINNLLGNNYDSKFRGYSDSLRSDYLGNVEEALRTLDDGLQSSDYLALSRILPGLDFNKMFFTGKSLDTTQSTSLEQLAIPQFYDYVAELHPLYLGNLSSLVLNNTITDNYRDLLDLLISFNKDQLLQLNIDDLPNPLKKPYINLLISLGIAPLSESEELYIIPNSQLSETVLTYDPRSKTLARKKTHELSYYRKLWINDYIQLYGTPKDLLSLYFTEFKKQGGIIKAQTGVKFSDNANWYTGVFLSNINHILLLLEKDSNYYKWLNDMQGKHASLYNAAGNNWLDIAYNNEAVGAYQDLYKSGYNNEWKGNLAGYNSLGILNALNLGMFDVSGSPRTSGDWNGNGKNWATDNLYSAITDYRRLLGREGDYNVHLLYLLTNLLRDRGYDIYLDADNYYKLKPISDPQTEQEILSLSLIPLKLNSLENGLKDNLEDIKSKIYPVKTLRNTDEFAGSRFGDFMLGITPDLIGTGRLFASLRTNNRVARTLNRSLRPVLKDTYERYSPITGAFGEMLFRNRLAADLRRLASRPFTSDASLLLAGLLDADRQARDLEYLGFLTDDKEIKRTQEAALARQEDNMARRSEVSNFNRASINQTNREKAELEATRLRHNWQSVDNFLQGVEGRLRTNLAERQAIRQNASLLAALTRYLEFLQRFNEDYKRDHPNATLETMLNDPYYILRVQNLRRRYQYDTYNIGLGKYYKDPYTGIYDKDHIPTYESILYSKDGGRLRPRVMTMINKVIKNESYT